MNKKADNWESYSNDEDHSADDMDYYMVPETGAVYSAEEIDDQKAEDDAQDGLINFEGLVPVVPTVDDPDFSGSHPEHWKEYGIEDIKESNTKKKADGGSPQTLYTVNCPKCDATVEVTPGEKAVSKDGKVTCPNGHSFEPTRYTPKSIKDKALPSFKTKKSEDHRFELDTIQEMENSDKSLSNKDKKTKKKK